MKLIHTTGEHLVEDVAKLYRFSNASVRVFAGEETEKIYEDELVKQVENRTEAEDEAAGHEDPRDVADRDYPHE